MNRGIFHPEQRLLPLILMAAFATLAGAVLWQRFGPDAGRAATEPRLVVPRADLTAAETTTIDLFENISPSVVFIRTTAVQRDLARRTLNEVAVGSGSGFVWDTAGHVVTNFHVIQESRTGRAFVRLADQQEYEARVIGVAPESDLAVLKINAPPALLPPIPIGTSANLRVGQTVLAVGNPFGFDQTLTNGIVSALGRVINSPSNRRIEGVIQHSAAINPGNSGGPLLDSAGRMIGVNTAIFSPSGASAGIGFAVPVDTVNRVVPQLIRFGRIRRPDLGVRWLALGPQMLQQLQGLPVGELVPGGPAAKAGLIGVRESADGRLMLGDIVQAMGERTIRSYDDLLLALENHLPGDVVTLQVWRAGVQRSVEVTLGEPSAD